MIYTCLSTAPPTLDLDVRIHVTRANSLVPHLLATQTSPNAVNVPAPLSPVMMEPPSPTDKNMSTEKVNDGMSEKGMKASRSDMAFATIEEAVSTQSGHGHSMGLGVEGTLMAAAIHVGRPNLQEIIQEEILCSTGPVLISGEYHWFFIHHFTCTMGIITLIFYLSSACGPTKLTKAIRQSVRGGAAGPSAMLHGGVPVSMYLENFGATRSGSSK